MVMRMIADREFTDPEFLGRHVYGMTESQARDIIKIRTWDQFRDACRGLQGVDHLVIYTHGNPGSLIISNHDRPFSTLRDFLTGMPQINTISLEGCNVAQDPSNMGVLGRLFRARTVSAYNMYHMVETVSVTIPQGTNAQEMAPIRDGLRPYRPFFATSLEREEDLQNARGAWTGEAGQHEVYCEWFRIDRINASPTLGTFGRPPRGFHARHTAELVELSEIRGLPGARALPSYHFKRVVITMNDAPSRQAVPPTERRAPDPRPTR